jgi:hypothetical protein
MVNRESKYTIEKTSEEVPLELTATQEATLDQGKRVFANLEAGQPGRYATCSAAKPSEPSCRHLVSRP